MGKTRTPAWLSKLKQVGEVLRVHKGSDSPPSSSSHISTSDYGYQSPTSAFIRRSCEAPELARSLSLRRAKARADAAAGLRSDASADASPLLSTSGHRLSRSIDALYALSHKEEQQEVEATAAAAEPAGPDLQGPGHRNLDRTTMALLATSLSRTKVAKHKELAERAARAAQELKARGGVTASTSSSISKVAALDESSAKDRVPLTIASNRASSRRKSASDLPVPPPLNCWMPDRVLRRSSDADPMLEPSQRCSDAGPSMCTSEDELDKCLANVSHARITSMSCSEDAWDNSSRHSRVTASEEACQWDASDIRGSWGSDLFGKLRAFKQLYSQGEGEKELEEEYQVGGSDFLHDEAWDTSDDDALGSHQDYLASPDSGWTTPSQTHQARTPSRRMSLGTPEEMASPCRRKLPAIPTRRDSQAHLYNDFGDEEKVLWKGAEPDSDTKAANRCRDSRCVAKKKHSKNLSCFVPDDVSGVIRESVAMVKYSRDPYVDFRHSILEMILEKDIHQPSDLEQLLHCYLTLNSPRQYHLIKIAFFDTWNELLARRSRTFWGAV